MLDYREIIQAEFDRRRGHNSLYSLRAFARNLDLSVGFLSRVLRQKAHLSPEKAVHVAEKLGYSRTEVNEFCRRVHLASIKKESVRNALGTFEDMTVEAQSLRSQMMDFDTFQMISDWYYGAILQLFGCEGFEPTQKYISRALGITAAETKRALDVLESLKFIERDESGRLKKRSSSYSIASEVPNRSIQSFHRQLLAKASDALEKQAPPCRDISGLMMNINEDRIPLVKKEIEKFKKKIALLVDTSRPTKVYHLGVQFFSLTETV